MDSTLSQADFDQQTSTQDETGTKRKAEQSNGTHTRSKRNRYISIAWYVWRHGMVSVQDHGRETEWHDADGLGALVTNASGARSSAMDKCRVSDADTLIWSVSIIAQDTRGIYILTALVP